MAYSRYATEMKDGDNNIYGLMDEEAREQLSDSNLAISNLYEAEQPEIDFSGLTIVEGKYMDGSGTNISTNAVFNYVSTYIPIDERWDSITVNRVIYTSDGRGYPQQYMVYFYTADKSNISAANYERTNTDTLQTVKIPYNAKYFRINLSAIIAKNFIKVHYKPVDKQIGFIGRVTGSFTSAELKSTTLELEPNTDYFLKSNNDPLGNINILDQGTSYKQLVAGFKWCHFKTTVGGAIRLYNIYGYAFDYDISVYKYNSEEQKASMAEEVYRISPIDARADFTSITDCFLALKDNASPKKIYIEGGFYNIYNEYVAANMPVYDGDDPARGYWDVVAWVPPNTHLIGLGLVTLSWQPNTTDNPEITYKQCQTVSPLNVRSNAIIENITIICKNGRYCIHDDPMGKYPYKYTKRLYRNVKCIKKVNERTAQDQPYGFAHVIGFGFDACTEYDFENCDFINEGTGYSFYGHSRQTSGNNTVTKNESPTINVTNCIIKSAWTGHCAKLGNVGSDPTNLQIQTNFRSCYFSGAIDVINETGTTNCPNAFDVTVVGCNPVTVNVADTSNPYPPQIYNFGS